MNLNLSNSNRRRLRRFDVVSLDRQGQFSVQSFILSMSFISIVLAILALSLQSSVSYAANPQNQIRPSVLPLILDIQSALSSETSDPAASNRLIETLLAKELTDYEQALAYQFAATLALETEDYQRAFNAYQTVWSLKVYSGHQQLDIQRTLAQLAMQLGQWQTSLDFYEPWINAINEGRFELKVLAQDYMNVAQSHYRLASWVNTLVNVNQALEVSQHPIPESWYRMKLTALLNLYEREHHHTTINHDKALAQENPLLSSLSRVGSKTLRNLSKEGLREQAIDVSKTLVLNFPSALYWRQLAWLYQQGQQAKDQSSALAALHSAYVSGYLTSEQDYLWMIGLMVHQKNYHQAGRMLSSAMTQQRITRTESNLKLLADTWILARDYSRAEAALRALLEKSDQANYRKTLQDVKALLQQNKTFEG